jgi:hypothetical protein
MERIIAGHPRLERLIGLGKGATLGSLAFSASVTAYRYLGPLLNSDQVKELNIDNDLKKIIDQFNKLHPKPDSNKDKPQSTVGPK